MGQGGSHVHSSSQWGREAGRENQKDVHRSDWQIAVGVKQKYHKVFTDLKMQLVRIQTFQYTQVTRKVDYSDLIQTLVLLLAR